MFSRAEKWELFISEKLAKRTTEVASASLFMSGFTSFVSSFTIGSEAPSIFDVKRCLRHHDNKAK